MSQCASAAIGQVVAGGNSHTVALKLDGTVWTWGNNANGQLGDGTTTNHYTPAQVMGLGGVISVAAGSDYTVALKSDGTVWAWGHNGFGQLGDGTTTNRLVPVQVNGLGGVVSIAASSYNHTVALKSDGTVWAWGDNSYGQLGDGTNIPSYTPVQVSGLSGVTAIAAGNNHTVALKVDGTVWSWGLGTALGYGTNITSYTPVQASGFGGAIAIAAAAGHTLALKSDGTGWGWGSAAYGELGTSCGGACTYYTRVQVNSLTDATAIAAGYQHSLAIKSDGTAWAWADNSYGQLGDETTTRRPYPVQVSVLSGFNNATAIAAGGQHTMALASDGTLWAWGANDKGQLGDGTTIQRHFPVPVSGPFLICSPSISPSNRAFDSAENSGSFNVSSSAGCAWTAASHDNFLTITSGWSGIGNGTVSYSVESNVSNCFARTGTITIGGQTFSVTQVAGAGSFSIAPTSRSHSASVESGSVTVTAGVGCSWSATSDANWITITGGGPGTGDGAVVYSVSANAGDITRTGTLTIAGQTFTIIQGAYGNPQPINVLAVVGDLPIVSALTPVQFSSGLTGAVSTCHWDFGDGGTSADCDPSYVFTNCGAFPVNVTSSDGVTTNSATTSVAVACALSTTNVMAKLNFARPNLDTCKLKAVPLPSQCTNWFDTPVTLDVGDAQVTFTLDAKGRGVSTNGTCRFAYKTKTGVCTFTAKLSHGSWQALWAPHGLVNATIPRPGAALTMPIILTIGDEAFMSDKPLHYIATANKSGTAK